VFAAFASAGEELAKIKAVARIAASAVTLIIFISSPPFEMLNSHRSRFLILQRQRDLHLVNLLVLVFLFS
jgi:hypothetical protein